MTRSGRTIDGAPTQAAVASARPAPGDGGMRAVRRLALGTALTDAASILAALLIAYHIRYGLGDVRWSYLIVIAVAPVLWVATFAALRLYGARHFAPEEEFRRVVAGVVIGIALAVMASYWAKAELSRLWLGIGTTLALAFELASRAAWRGVRARLESRGVIALRTIIVGTNDEARRLAVALRSGSGFEPVGFVSPEAGPASSDVAPVLGTVDMLDAIVRAHAPQCIAVAATAVDAHAVGSIAAVARRAGLELRISSRLPAVLTTRLGVHRVGGTTVISVMPPRLSRTQRAVKRAFDLVAAACLLVLTAPAWPVIALAVRVGSAGPVVFRQQRVTRAGRVFTMLKFRTMTDGAAHAIEVTPFAKPHDDPRVTRVGRLLRRFSLDELPQLLNVLRGDMSLVGPRPLPVEQILANPDLAATRHDVPAGMTGWWQISGRSDLSPDEALALDLFYVENWSLAYDLYILARTLGVVVSGRGAR